MHSASPATRSMPPPVTTAHPPASSAISPALRSVIASINDADVLPPFLCPTLTLPPPNASSFPTPTPGLNQPRPRIVDRYAKDSDGQYRRTDDYTLYGSRICSACPTSSTSTSSQPAQQTSADDLELPPGWGSHSSDSPTRNNIIMALSIVLAVIICITASCWSNIRSKRKRKLLLADIELENMSSLSLDSYVQQKEEDRELKAKKRIWALATARWKSNARYSARQRKGRRVAETLMSRSTPLFPSHSAAPPPLSSIAPSSNTGSATSSPSISRSSSPAINSDLHSRSPSLSRSQLSITPRQPFPEVQSPPAYRSSPTSDLPYMRKNNVQSRPSQETESVPDEDEESLEPYSPPVAHTGHAAIDDKSLLSRLPSEPPVPALPCSAGPSAPEWRDEEFDDFGPDASSIDPSLTATCPPFPLPPPSAPSPLLSRPPTSPKGKSTAMLDYPFDVDLQSFDEPSAPPFSTEPNTEASAPPLLDPYDDDASISNSGEL